jgi:hypothetical protein
MEKKMEKKKERLAGLISAAALVCLAVSAAYAGPRYGQPGVSIFVDGTGAGYAMGTLGGTRDSADVNERLSCLVSRSETTSSSGAKTRSTSVSCSARDTSRRTVSCTATTEAMANALSGVSNDSLLEFHFDRNAKCTDIVVYESTSLERKS